MSTTAGTRRSPRFIENLSNGLIIPSLSSEQTVTLLALCHCTGWSADAISRKFADLTGVELSAEIVWDHHWSWVFGRNGDPPEKLSAAEWDIMQVLMRNIGVDVEKPRRPLSETVRPTSVKFADQWCAKNFEGFPLFSGWTSHIRETTKGYLLGQEDDAYGMLSKMEERAMAKFGEPMLRILRNTLKEWAQEMIALVNRDPGLRPIREQEHVDLIMNHLKIFQAYYEDKFGKMETAKQCSAFGEIKDNTVFIKSTGYGVKVVLGLIMADRMHVVEKKRKNERERRGFMLVAVEDLEHDSKECPICHDPMGVESPDGSKESPIRLVICCGQVLGMRCLKTWLAECVFDEPHDNCPICRFTFPTSFLKTLFMPAEYVARLASQGDDEDDLRSPSPEPAGPVRSQQEQDAFLQQQVGGEDSDSESDLMDMDDVNERHGPPPVGARRPPMAVGGYAWNEVELNDVEEGEVVNDELILRG